jgi:hypothetical protein
MWSLQLPHDLPKKEPATTQKRTYLEAFLRRVETPTADEFTAYLQDPVIHIPEGGIDLFQWWYAHRERYPTLHQMALDVLSIPAMATECERLFSGAG